MGWVRAAFKGKEVWAQVDPTGSLVVEGGRVPIRYSNKSGAKVYRAGASGVAPLAGAAVEDLPDGTSADSVAAKKNNNGSGFGKAGTRTKSQAAAAAVDARERLAALPEGTVICYTDGGCKGNPGPAGSGVVVELLDGRVAEASRSLGVATNNIAELTAVDMALDLLDEGDVPPAAPVALFTDSKYTNGVLCLGWKAKKNQDLIAGIRRKLAARPGVTVYWVAGHVGIEGNERADVLANQGIAGNSETFWH